MHVHHAVVPARDDDVLGGAPWGGRWRATDSVHGRGAGMIVVCGAGEDVRGCVRQP